MDTHSCARWSIPAQTTLVLSSCLVLAAGTGCNQDDGKVTSIEVTIRSDFLVGDELSFVYVESLSANEEDVVQRAWLELDADCADGREGARLLGSIDVERREDDTAHLRLRGYHRTAGGEAELLAERRVDLRFDRGARATVDLLRTCAATPGDCDGGLCLPSTCTNASAVVTGAEGANGLEDCLSRATVEPVIALPDAGLVVDDDETPPLPPTPVAACGDEDGTCPEGCTRFEDTDCTLHLGDACTASADCDTGLSCADGVCCESSCEAECFRCDLRGLAGYCRDTLEAQVAPSSGPYEENCEERKLTVRSTDDGRIETTCFDGFSQCASVDAYLAQLLEHGCDVDLGTAANCGACGTVCPYGVCASGQCVSDKSGVLANSASITLHAGEAMGIVVTPKARNTVRGLGVLLESTFVAGTLRLAIYSDTDGSMLPENRLASTATLTPVRGPGGITTVEAPVDLPFTVDPLTTYFVFVAPSDAMVAAGAPGEDVPAAPSDPTFAALLADRALMATMERRNLKFAQEAPSALYVQRGVESLSRPPRLSEPGDESSECHCGSNGVGAEPALRPVPSLRTGPLRNEEVRLYLAPSAGAPSALRTYALAPRQVQQTILRAKRGGNTQAVAVVRIRHFVAPLETKPQDLPRVRRLSGSQVVALLPEFEPF